MEKDKDSIVDQSLLEGEDDLSLDTDGGDLTDDALDLPGDRKDAEDKDGKKDDDAADDDGIEIVLEGQETLDDEERKAAAALERGGDDGQDAQDGRDGDDRTSYSKNVQNRIARADRIARDATARATAAHHRANVAEALSRATQKEALDITEQALNTQLKSTQDALVKAKEDGKAADEVALTTTLGQLSNRIEGIKTARRQLAESEEAAKRGAAAENAPNHLVAEWKERNPWYGHARYPEQTALTQVIDKQLRNDGYDPQTSQYFEELSRRVRRRIPEVVKHIKPAPGQRRQREEPRRDPAAPVQRSGGDRQQPRQRAGKIIVTKADQANMARFGLDPTNKEHLKEYALNKRGS